MHYRTVSATLLALVLALAACTNSDSDQAGASTAAPATSGQSFPVAITHAFGETTIESQPQRIVALGNNDIAVATALGAPVVGAMRGYNPSSPNLPYLAAPLPPEVLNLSAESLELEKVAAHRPDLILATSSYLVDEQSYDMLSRVAPVVVYEKSLYGASPNEEALLIGRALGRESEAQQLVEESDAAIAAVTSELPGLAGRSYLFGQARSDVLPMVVGQDNQSTLFMRRLGLLVPAEFTNAAVSDQLAPGTIGLSYEQVSQLDSADLLFMTFATAGDKQQFESNQLVRDLAAVRGGRYLATSLDTAIYLQAPNVVGTEWFLEQVGPTLRQVGA